MPDAGRKPTACASCGGRGEWSLPCEECGKTADTGREPSPGRVLPAVLRGLVTIAVMFAVPLLVALAGDRAVGLPDWLVLAPVACWAVFTALFLAVAASLLLAAHTGDQS